jgi:ubiquinone/menaquinone biosynthesis C-methylase UbiE
MHKVLPERWKIAQNSEREYWDEFDDSKLLSEEIIRHKEKAKILEKEWSSFKKLNKNTRILQIGCGPEDVINYFSIGKCYAIDPLADFYKKKFNLDYKKIEFIQARGEELPFENDFFDIVILANVLDHVENPQKVLSEINRIMKKDAIFHFENLYYQKGFIALSKIWGPLKQTFTGNLFNVHHPYMFQLTNLKKLLFDNFNVIHEEAGREIMLYNNVKELKKFKMSEKKITTKIPAIFGLYGTINYIAFCQKKN